MKEEAGKKIMRDVFLGFVRVHVLHHAGEGPIFGLDMMEELKRHGYDIGPGTLYPLLHGLEKAGLLVSMQEVVEGRGRRYYRTTKSGDALLLQLRTKIRELVDEVLGAGVKRKPRARSGRPR
jgi:DNA-binding PadR family transcriptional regulator